MNSPGPLFSAREVEGSVALAPPEPGTLESTHSLAMLGRNLGWRLHGDCAGIWNIRVNSLGAFFAGSSGRGLGRSGSAAGAWNTRVNSLTGDAWPGAWGGGCTGDCAGVWNIRVNSPARSSPARAAEDSLAPAPLRGPEKPV